MYSSVQSMKEDRGPVIEALVVDIASIMIINENNLVCDLLGCVGRST